MIRNFALSFAELVQRTGAKPPRSGRSKWRCGHCKGKSWTLSVDLQKEVAHCFRCGWGCGRRLLERELGIESQKPTQVQLRERRMICGEAEQFAEWVRLKRIATAALLRDLDKYELQWSEDGRQQLAAGEPAGEEVFGKLQAIAAWQERAEARYSQLCEFEKNAAELYAEFMRRGKAA